jgi:hypothetical protein
LLRRRPSGHEPDPTLGDEYDGVITRAPAFRYAQQQVLHVFPSAVEHTLDSYPRPCELEKIVNASIEACDALDGRTDGVISRTDLCKLNFNLTSIIGEAYSCAATTSTSLGFGFSTKHKRQAPEGSQASSTPEQNRPSLLKASPLLKLSTMVSTTALASERICHGRSAPPWMMPTLHTITRPTAGNSIFPLQVANL